MTNADSVLDPDYCQHCGAGPSKFMLGCCDTCSEKLADYFAAIDRGEDAEDPFPSEASQKSTGRRDDDERR
jgi:hypothetical protein